VLYALGETINIMTLAALHWPSAFWSMTPPSPLKTSTANLEAGKELEQSIIDGSAQDRRPRPGSTLAICIVFVPMFFLSGVAKYPLRAHGRGGGLCHAGQLLPLPHPGPHHMAKYLLREHDDAEIQRKRSSRNPFIRFPERL